MNPDQPLIDQLVFVPVEWQPCEKPKHMPDAQEIADACERIRSTWSKREELRRRYTVADPIEIDAVDRVCRVSKCMGNGKGDDY